MSSSHYPSHMLGGPCIADYAGPYAEPKGDGKICGVPRYLCTDCQGEHYAFPCDDFKTVIGIALPDCLHCINHESDIVASVWGSRLRSCMVEPCRFERKVER